MSWHPEAGFSPAAMPVDVAATPAPPVGSGGSGSAAPKRPKARKPKEPKDPSTGGSKKRKNNAAAAAATTTTTTATAVTASAARSEPGRAETAEAELHQDGSGGQSRRASMASNVNAGAKDGSTSSKRHASAKGAKGKSRGSMRADSRGSRATSARGSMSVAPSGAQGGPVDDEQDAEGQAQQGDEEREDDDDDDDDDDDEEGGEQTLEEDDWQRQEAIQKARSVAMGPLMRAMDETQQDRYSVYRRSFLDKRHVKKLVNHLTNQNTTKQVVTLTAALGKVFIGDIVERARKVQQARGATGPLRPEHLLEAHRLYKEEREVPGRFPPGAPSASAGTGGNGKRRRLF